MNLESRKKRVRPAIRKKIRSSDRQDQANKKLSDPSNRQIMDGSMTQSSNGPLTGPSLDIGSSSIAALARRDFAARVTPESASLRRIMVINGPNLNMLGLREKSIYGASTLTDIEHLLQATADSTHCDLVLFQSNSEGDIINAIQAAKDQNVRRIIINAGAYTHTSIAIRDALLAVNIPFYEVHISNVFARESFRHNSFLSDKAVAVISGLGAYGYVAAMGHAVQCFHEDVINQVTSNSSSNSASNVKSEHSKPVKSSSNKIKENRKAKFSADKPKASPAGSKQKTSAETKGIAEPVGTAASVDRGAVDSASAPPRNTR